MADTEFRPDWRLPPSAALATQIRLALQRRGIAWTGKLDTDAQWEQMGLEIINGLRQDTISPCQLVELPRPWDGKCGAMKGYKFRHWLFFAAILIGAASPVAGLAVWRWSVWGTMVGLSVMLLSVAVMLTPDD